MDISELQAFVSVAEHGSFSRAAQALYLTQPAISKRIARLESELGEALFDRLGRQHIRLTEAGRALLPHARATLHRLDDGLRAIQQLSNEVSGRLRLGTSHHIGLHHLPPILRRYHERYPEVELDLRFMGSEQACHQVEQGELEIALVTLPNRPKPSLRQHVIWPDPLAVVVAPAHPLAQQEKVQAGQLCDYPAILPERNTYTRELLENALPRDASLTVSLATNYLEIIRMMVSVGLGWSVLPMTLVNEELKPLRIEGLELERQLGVIQHRQRTLSNAALAMLSFLGERSQGRR